MRDKIEEIVLIAVTVERQRILNELLVWCGLNDVNVTSLASKISHLSQVAPRSYDEWRSDCNLTP